jgi:hypothetical protein
MFNKKLGLLVLAAATMGLVACGGNSSSAAGSSKADGSQPTGSSKADGSQPTGVSENSGTAEDLPPVADGKVTVYFEFGKVTEDCIDAIPSHCSPFITGGFCGWKTSMDGEEKPAEMIKSGKYYYAQIDATKIPTGAEATDVSGRGFQITLGWNNTSGAPASQQGVDWSYKSTLSGLYPGASHPKMPAPVGGRIHITSAEDVVADPLFPEVTSDDHWMNDPEKPVATIGFTAAKAAPVAIAEYVQPIKIKNWAEVKDVIPAFHVAGGFNGWHSQFDDTNKLVFNENGETSIKVTNVYSGVKIEFQICAKIDETNFWADANKYQKDNLSFTPLTSDEGEGDVMELTWPTPAPDEGGEQGGAE